MVPEADAATIATVLGITNVMAELQEFPISVAGAVNSFLVRRFYDRRQIIYLMRWHPDEEQWTANELMWGEPGQHLAISDAAVDRGTIRLNFVTWTKDE
ncbi:MAG: hypothetical protein Q7S23_04310 [bacterium]|nr:hypothetical protein [bacterium]